MSMFGSSTKAPGEKPPTQVKGAAAVTSLSIVGAGMTVRGDLETEGVVKVEGTVEGRIWARAQVLVAKGGVVHGDIETSEAVVGGAVHGSIRAKDRVEVQTGAAVEGDVTTRRISVAEGGTLNGQIKMGTDEWRWEAPGAEPQATSQPPLGSGVMRSASVPLTSIGLPLATGADQIRQ